MGIADDPDLARRGLLQCLLDYRGMQVIAKACNGHETLEMIREDALDGVTLDLTMLGYGGLDMLGNIKIRAPQTGVLVLSGLAEAVHAGAAERGERLPQKEL